MKPNKLTKITFLALCILSTLVLNAQVTLFTEGFESANVIPLPTSGISWRQYNITSGYSEWQIKNTCSPPGGTRCLNVRDSYNSTDCDYGWDNSANRVAYYGTKINATGYSTLNLSFKWKASGETGYDYGQVVWSTDGTTWTLVNATKYSGQTSWQTVSNLNLSAAGGQQFYIGFQWINDGGSGSAPGFCIDDVLITGVAACTAPTTQASSFSTSSVSCNSMTANWTRGSGNQVIVLAKAGSAVNSDPVSGTSYTANATFGSGSQIGTGNYVVYAGSSSSVNVTGLTGGTTYYYALYEYNTVDHCYKTPALTGNATANCTPPGTQASSFSIGSVSNNSISIGWGRGNGDNVIVIAKAGSAPTNPVNCTSYTANANYGSGSSVGGGYCVYNGTGSSATVTGLTANTTYYFAVYEYVAASNCYKTPALSANQLTANDGASINHPTSGSVTYYMCSGNYYDNGGVGANYSNSIASSVVTIYPTDATSKVRVNFSAFATESATCATNYDWLKIYDGNSTGATQINCYSTGGNIPGIITSTAADGSLTFQFKSDAGTTGAGWSAAISCFIPCGITAGTVSGATTICGSGTANLSIAGYQGGSTLQWQKSTDNITFSDVAGATSATYSASPVSTTYYRCKVINGCFVYANSVLVTVASTPSTPPTPYSLNNPDCGNVKLWEAIATGANTVYYWQGTNSSGTSTANNANIPYYAISSGTYYVRAYNTSTTCWSSSSSSLAVTVTGPTGGSVSGGATVCKLTTNSTTLSLSGYSGSIVRWEKSVAPFTYWDPISNTTTSCTIANVTEDTRVRAVIQSTSCSAITFSSYATITTTSSSTANAGINQYICSGTTATMAATGAGNWTVTEGSSSVTTPTSPTSNVTGLSSGVNTFQWNVSGTCPALITITRY